MGHTHTLGKANTNNSRDVSPTATVISLSIHMLAPNTDVLPKKYFFHSLKLVPNFALLFPDPDH